MALNHEKILGSNRETPCVREVFGISGSGKSVFLHEMLKEASRSKAYGPLWRAVVFDVKHEGYASLLPKKMEPCTNMTEVVEQMKNSRITVVHPEVMGAQGFLDDLIHYLFATAERVKGFSATLILEESSTFIKANSLPASIKRFATQGRSRGLALVVANQRSLSNKWIDTQAASVTLFRLARPDADMLSKRWGICPDNLETRLGAKKFSFAYFDLETLSLDFYEPVAMTSERLTAKAEIKPSKPEKPFGGGFGPEGGFKPFGV
jgi:hypothetical protein